MTGTIKTLRDKGFGFIAVEGQTKDIFFRSKTLAGVIFDELKEGDRPPFELVDAPQDGTGKGPAATKVSRV
jgi:cold shock CspA family protein